MIESIKDVENMSINNMECALSDISRMYDQHIIPAGLSRRHLVGRRLIRLYAFRSTKKLMALRNKDQDISTQYHDIFSGKIIEAIDIGGKYAKSHLPKDKRKYNSFVNKIAKKAMEDILFGLESEIEKDKEEEKRKILMNGLRHIKRISAMYSC